MTQLEEYLEQRKKYAEESRASREIIRNEKSTKEEKAKARRKYSLLITLIEELDVQIRALDPEALKPKRKGGCKGLGGSKIRLDAVTGDNFHNHGRLMGELYGKADNYNLDPASPVIQWMNEAVAQLYPRQAQAIDLYYNQGLSQAKCAEIMGVKTTPEIYQFIRRGLKCIYHWVQIRTLVTKCAISSPFDWDRFLDEMDILSPGQLEILLTLLDCKEGELITPKSLAAYLGIRDKDIAKRIKNVKGVLTAIGIPEDETNDVHPIFLGINRKKFHTLFTNYAEMRD